MKKIYTILAFLAIIIAPKTSSAMLQKAIEEAYNTIPISPVINFGEDIVETGKVLGSTLSRITSLANQMKNDANSMKSSITSTFQTIMPNAGINFKFGSEGGNKNTIMCYDPIGKVNVSKMSKKMREILLSYKSPIDKERVKSQRLSFYMDNVYNIYAAIQLIKDEMEEGGSIYTQIMSTKECVGEGQGQACNIPSTTDGGNNEMLYTYGYALTTLEELVKTWERIAALKAQFKALKAIMAIELLPQSEDDNQAFLDKPQNKLLVGEYKISTKETIASAQMVYKSTGSGLSKIEIQTDENQSTKAAGDNKNDLTSNKSSKYGAKGLNFVSPKVPENNSPILENSEKLNAYNNLSEVENATSDALDLHNYIKKLEAIKSSAEQYKDMQLNYIKKLVMLKDSNQCGRGYISRYFSSVDKTWAGRSLSDAQINDYDLRKGISGWALDAYEVAKAAKTNVSEDENGDINYSNSSSIQTQDLETETLSDEDTAGARDGLDIEKADSKVQKNTDSYDEGEGVSDTASKKTQEENRASALLAWQIGAEASKSLGSNAKSWGTPSGRKMIWNDTKIFYNQYLKRKYDNIKAYLKKYTKADVVDVLISQVKDEIINIDQTDYQQQLNSSYATVDALLNALTGNNNSSSGVTSADASLLKQEKELVAQVDSISKESKELSDELGDISSNAQEEAFDSMDKAALKDVDYLGEDKPSGTTIKKLDEVESEASELDSKNLKENNFDELQKKHEKVKDDRSKLYNKLAALRQTMLEAKVEKQNALSGQSSLNAEIRKTILGFVQEGQNLYQQYNLNVEDRLDEAVALINPEKALYLKGVINSAAEEVIEFIEGSVDSIVGEAYAELMALGDDLYLPYSSGEVQAIHQKMIEKLQALTFTKSVAGYSVTNMLVFADLASQDLSAEKEGFFVGALPRMRDLKAPYPMKDLSQPPVREVFHFDATDFHNVKPYSHKHYVHYHDKIRKDLHEKRNKLFMLVPGGLAAEVFEEMLKSALNSRDKAEEEARKLRSIAKEDFLNCGSEIPAIWKMMLQDNAFIESQFMLQEALNQGCEAAAFLRGGIMPCRVGSSNVVLDVNVTKEYNSNTKKDEYSYDNEENQYIKRTDIPAAGLPKCLLIEMKKNSPHLVFYDDDVDVLSNLSSFLNGNSEPVERNCLYSELGMLLDADENNNLSFKETVYEVFNDVSMIDKKYENSSDKMKKKEKNSLSIAMQAELSRNQIGDFIRQAETEKKLRQSLDEIKQKYEEQIADLKESLANYGYSLSDNYDITRAADYKLTVDRIKSAKTKAINKVLSLMNNIKIDADNEPAMEKKTSIDKLISIMQKDKDGYLELSMSSADENNLEESLKRTKADKEATDKYKKEVEDTNEKYKDLEEAYCANY